MHIVLFMFIDNRQLLRKYCGSEKSMQIPGMMAPLESLNSDAGQWLLLTVIAVP
jgi:hypothetical protein